MSMGFVFGALVGVSSTLIGNAIRKVPLLREPWWHLVGIGFGGFLGTKILQLDNYLEQKNKELTQKLLEKNKKAATHPDYVPIQRPYLQQTNKDSNSN